MIAKNGFSLKQVRRNSFVILIVLLLFVLSACENSKIDDDKLVKIYVENLIIEETHQNNPGMLKQKKDSLFNKFNTSKTAFENELNLIGNDRERWEKFFTKSKELLEDLRKSGAVN